MSTPRSILRPLDVVLMTAVKLDFNPCTFRELERIEEIEAINCLGMDFWQLMFDSLADYSDSTEYQAAKTYEIGDVVYWKGSYRMATEETSSNPDDVTKWKDAPRFDSANECAADYEIFFCKYLGPYLAHVVLSERLPYIVTQIRDTGIEYGGRKINAQDDKRYTSLENAIFRDREKCYMLMEHYLKRDAIKDKPCFSKWSGRQLEEDIPCTCQKETCDECRSRRPRYVGRTRWG